MSVSHSTAQYNEQPTLIVEGLVKRYGNFVAVNGIGFTVNPGETFGLLGPNGAGKTTTLEMIEGLRTPSAGRIVVHGLDVTRESRRVRSLIGVQVQEAGFFERLTVKETIDTFGRFFAKRLPTAWLLERLQLQEKAGSLVETLSGGQRQRLSIALALVNDPRIVFLDEPTTGLDPQARRNLWETIRSIQKEGRTVILTTHYMDEAEELCDRVAIIDQGEIIALDSPVALIQTHTPWVKIYITPVAGEEPEALCNRLGDLPGADHVGASETGDVIVTARHLEETIGAIVQLGQGNAIEYKALRVEAANLEDVFLKLTGRQLRE